MPASTVNITGTLLDPLGGPLVGRGVIHLRLSQTGRVYDGSNFVRIMGSQSFPVIAGVVDINIVPCPEIKLHGEYVTDGGLEKWDTPNTLTEWNEFLGGGAGTTINQDTVEQRSGSNCVRFDMSEADDSTISVPNQVLVLDKWYYITFWYKADSAITDGADWYLRKSNDTFYYWHPDTKLWTTSAPTSGRLDCTTEWQKAGAWVRVSHETFVATDVFQLILWGRASTTSAGDKIYYDDVSMIGPFDGESGDIPQTFPRWMATYNIPGYQDPGSEVWNVVMDDPIDIGSIPRE